MQRDSMTPPNKLGTRIRELRKWLRISQKTVGEFLEIPRTAVSELEANKRDISADELMRLSTLFRSYPNSLYGLTPTPVDAANDVAFKARINSSNASLDDHDKKELTNFSYALKEILRYPVPPRRNASELVQSLTPQLAAMEFASTMGCSAPVDIYSILVKIGLYPRFTALNGLAGALVRSEIEGKDIYGVLINSDQLEERMRFSAAHELAHYVLGHLHKNEVVHASPKARWKDAIESDADSFAAELLMPKIYLNEHFQNLSAIVTAMDVIALADDLLVSYQAILHRLLELGHISRVNFEAFSNEKPTELREQLKNKKQSRKSKASKEFNTKELGPLLKMVEQNVQFMNTPDSVRWLQEAAYMKYCQTTHFNDRASDVKDVYEQVALWMAEEHPLRAFGF